MTERPILMSAPMVRAILEGRKTQTRRIVKPQPAGEWAAPGKTACPFGSPGDLLWVRETWAQVWQRKDGQRFTSCDPNKTYVGSWYEYAATADEPPPKWRASIHMPRKASRITLKVTDVRVERLQEISELDAIAEGCFVELRSSEDDGRSYCRAYKALWNSINGPDSWAANPFVWVVSFERLPMRAVRGVA